MKCIQEVAVKHAGKIDYKVWLDGEHPEVKVKMLVAAVFEDGAAYALENSTGGWIDAAIRMPKIGEIVLWKGFKTVQEVTETVVNVTNWVLETDPHRYYLLVPEN